MTFPRKKKAGREWYLRKKVEGGASAKKRAAEVDSIATRILASPGKPKTQNERGRGNRTGQLLWGEENGMTGAPRRGRRQ